MNQYKVGDIIVVCESLYRSAGQQVSIGIIREVQAQNMLTITWSPRHPRYVSENFNIDLGLLSGCAITIYTESQWEELLELCIE